MTDYELLSKALSSSDNNKKGLIPQNLFQDSDTDDGQLLGKDFLGLTNKEEQKRASKINIQNWKEFLKKVSREIK